LAETLWWCCCGEVGEVGVDAVVVVVVVCGVVVVVVVVVVVDEDTTMDGLGLAWAWGLVTNVGQWWLLDQVESTMLLRSDSMVCDPCWWPHLSVELIGATGREGEAWKCDMYGLDVDEGEVMKCGRSTGLDCSTGRDWLG